MKTKINHRSLKSIVALLLAFSISAASGTVYAQKRESASPQSVSAVSKDVEINDKSRMSVRPQEIAQPVAERVVETNRTLFAAPGPDVITAGTYGLATSTGLALVDMSSGTTTLVGAGSDDGNSVIANIGFDFWYDGVRFTQFGANANGFIRLGSVVSGLSFDNSTDFASTTNAPKIAAFYDDLCTGTTGKVHVKTIGSAPDRRLVVEWQNMQITRGAGCAGVGGGTFQLWLFESAHSSSPGAITFVYGPGMVATAAADGGYSVGLQSGAATNFASVTTSTNTVSYAAANNTQTGAIAATRFYRFDPNLPAAPTGLTFAPVTATSIQLNWTDNATNEVGYVIYRSLDGANFSFVTQIAANSVSFNDTGLTPSTTYFYRVHAVSEGILSAALAGSQATGAAGTPLSGSYNVPGDFASLTNAGGIFAALNTAGASSNITINITADITGETGANALNQLGFTVLIKPSLGPIAGPIKPRMISGTSTGSGLIKLNGADGVTIDGSFGGGTDRNMAIANGNAGATVIWIASAGASNGASNNTVKNCLISGNTGVTAVAGILSGSGTVFGGEAEAPNSNNTIRNNAIFRVQNSAFLVGNGMSFDQNWQVIGNTFGSTVAADKNTFRGMLIGNADGFGINGNTITGIVSPTDSTSTTTGIQVGFAAGNGQIIGNKISDIKQTNPEGWGANGIWLVQSSTTAQVFVVNNFISDVTGQGFNDVTSSDNGYGIMIQSGGQYAIWENSINLGTNQGVNAASGITAAMNIAAAVPAGSVQVLSNIFSDPQTLGTRYGVLNSSTAGAAVFNGINNNLYFAQNVGRQGGIDRVTLAAWQAATGLDGNSRAGDPLFLSATNLHITCASPAADGGSSGLVPTDIDGQTRSATAPDIGADEITAPVASSAVSRLTHTGVGMAFDIFLPLVGPITSESRNGGGNYKIIFTFASPVTVSGAALSLGTGSAGAPLGSGTNTITVNLTGVTDFQRITVKLLCVDDGAGASGDVAVSLNMLIGDATGNSNVNASDIGFTKSQSGAPVGLGNFFADYNLSSPTINASDIGQAKSKSGNVLPQ
jgi:hypothetical protein